METDSKPWECSYCTFMNEPSWLACGMCFKECKQTNFNDDFDYSFYGDVLDELALNAAPEIVQPAVATVSAVAAVTTVASVTAVEPITGTTPAIAHCSGVFPVAQTPNFINATASIANIPVTTETDTIFTPYAQAWTVNAATVPVTTETDTIFTPYATAHTVNATTSRYVPSFDVVNSKNVTSASTSNVKAGKYAPYGGKPVSTNVTFTNGARLITSRRLVRIASPVTITSSTSNAVTPVCDGNTRLRVINPRSNPSLFTANSLATVTSTATSVPIATSYNAVTAATSLVSPHITGLFTSISNDFGALDKPTTYGDIPMASTSSWCNPTPSYNIAPVNAVAHPRRTETPLTFHTRSDANTFSATSTSTQLPAVPNLNPAADCFFNPVPSNVPTPKAQPYLTPTPFTFSAAGSSVGSFASTSNATIAPVVAAAPNVKGAARVTTAAFATDSITGWMCTYCTFTNDNLLLRCAVCDTVKPKDRPVVQPTSVAQLPPVIQPTSVAQLTPVVQPTSAVQPIPRVPAASNENATFECPLCYLLFAEAEGMSLANCGHKFCKNCLREVINYSAENELKCPHKIRGVVCNSPLTDEEIGSILSFEYAVIDVKPAQLNTAPAEVIDLCSDNEDESRSSSRNLISAAAVNPATIGKEIDYQELLELEKEVLIPNIDEFDCSICMTEQGPGEGVVMRECLHTFCRECLKQAIKCNTDAEMKCPYGDGTTRCDSTLQDREIRALVDADVFEKHLKRSMTEAENKSSNAFHCKTVDCDVWCEFEDGVSVFTCPKCSQTNCINCKAIHAGMDCKQYQMKVELNSANNPDDAKTNKMLQNMLKKGTAMNCPKCQIILSKATGCDWLCCSMCKTEICWVTRGPRWGPKGHGDNSGGCQCRYKGKRCHPKCGNCH